MKKLYELILISTLSLSTHSCSTYSTDLNEMETINIKMDQIKKGESCSRNLFGGFTLPYIGDTAIKINGDESVISALKKGGISNVYAIDRSKLNFVFYSKRCTIVFGN